MQRILHLIIKILEAAYKKISFKASGTMFCLLFNIRAALLRKEVRFIFDKHQNIYKAQSLNYVRFFYSKKQNWNSYSAGMGNRAINLGEAYFCNLIDFKQNDLVIDCGANVGDLELYFREKKLDIRYIGIEPSPLEYECLRRNVTKTDTLNLGLWFENSSLKFYVSSDHADSSFIQPIQYKEILSIPTKRLDSLFDEPIKLLKLEAEGAEPEVLQGCEKIISRIEYISADLGFERGLSQESTLAPVTNFLLQNGYELLTVGYPRIVALYKRRDTIN